jgi:hypothetical protein
MAIYVKNNKQTSDVWCGQEIQSSAYYLLESQEESKWANNGKVLSDVSSGDLIVSSENNSSGHITDVVEAINYLRNIVVEVDEEGRQITKIAAAKKGTTYLAHFFEFETSKDGSLECKDWQNNNDTSLSIKFFDVNGTEITSKGNYLTLQLRLDVECVRTEVLFKPSYSFELIGGTLKLAAGCAQDCRVWVIAGAVELGVYGVKEFVRNMNLKFLGADETMHTDGRASKFMAKDTDGVPYQTNQIKMIIRHSAGYKLNIMMDYEYFR